MPKRKQVTMKKTKRPDDPAFAKHMDMVEDIIRRYRNALRALAKG
jgi:hypothetical protein